MCSQHADKTTYVHVSGVHWMKCEDMYVYHALCVWLSLAWLRKHVVFGRVVAGMEVVQLMENAITDPQDKPYMSVTVANCGQLVCAHRNQTTCT